MAVQVRLGKEFANFEVSKGTLNKRDLLINYHQFLMQHYKGYGQSGECEEVQRYIDILTDDWGVPLHVWDSISYYVNETLPDMIAEIAPVGYYFGSHVGSTADIGFWSVELLEDFTDY